MKSKQGSVLVIVLENGVRIETDEDYTTVYAKYSEAIADDHAAFKAWINSEAVSKYRPPRHHTFKVTDRKTGDEVALYPTQVDRMILEEVEKPEEVVRDQDEELTTGETGSSRVTLVDGTEVEVEEDFDTVNARWNAALRGENGTPVLSLTEKDSGWGLAILAENIELVEEMR